MKKIIYLVIFLLLIICVLLIIGNNKQSDSLDIKKDITKEKYFKKENYKRYIKYKDKNKNKKLSQIIVEVNIGLDNPFYTNIKQTTNEKTEYVLVNKYNYLKKDFVPDNLVILDNTKIVDFVKDTFNEMKHEMKKNNLNIVAVSGYRSYNYQYNLYNKYVKIDGINKADTYSARAGFSEHQTGLAIDISNGKTPYTEFENTEEFKWMQDNAYKYGFILRYPKGKEHITGYIYEAWHYRYVGVNISTYIKKHNITFDEYYVKFIES